ncbi:hypothetical protein L6164_006393 [Bauhinia variegata]|uniref:Uncharacterized protein n=1 Tax=Bauhinia variegata TaxID=167791 RepID=A0ACB9PUW1_BAUVA|nr:hypothetical protein L6164_006393 [Bauhinia variegata]
MVFPSVPVYLDPPNWPKQQHHGVGSENPQLPPPPQPPPSTVVVGGRGSSTRPGSMTDRARLAKMPQPETALKCPRCESTNTKFCYYNNYSLSQPRHVCKTCRRYWTRGGALRNVPVGGGCRRNKRSNKGSSRSKSPAKADNRQGGLNSTSGNSSSSCTTDVLSHFPTPSSSQLPFLPTLNEFSDYVSGDIGFHFGAISPSMLATNGNPSSSNVQYHIARANGGSLLTNGQNEQWGLPNLQQVVHHHHHQQQQQQLFPFLTNLESPTGLFQVGGENAGPASYAGEGGQLRSKTLDSGVSEMPQLTSVKMEENHGLSLSKNLLASSGNDQFWSGGNTWNDIPSFNSSTSRIL